MEPPAVQGHHFDEILSRLTRADDPATALDEQETPFSPPQRIENIEKLPPGLRASSLYHHLREIRATCAEPKVRLAHATRLAPLISETVTALMAQPKAAADRRLAISLPIALLKCHYDIAKQATAQSARLPFPDIPLIEDCILAALNALLDLFVCYWLQHLPPPERFWGELHALYLLASQVPRNSADGMRKHKADTRQRKPRKANTRTQKSEASQAIRAAYLKPLLLGSLNPTRFNTGEIKQLVSFVASHAPLARLGAAKGLLRIDPTCNRPPSYARTTADDNGVSLCTRRLIAAIGADDVKLTARLKTDLHRYWSSEQVRSEPHKRANQRVEIVFGLEAAHQLLTGCVDDDDFLVHLGCQDVAQRIIATPPVELRAATCIDRSPSGARLRLTGAPEVLRPGELVALLLTGESQCRLGIIRWTQLTPKLDSVAGLQWLPESIHPSGAAAVGGALTPTPYFRTFFLPAASALDSSELIAPTGTLKPGDRVHLVTHQGDLNLVIANIVDMTFHVSRFGTTSA